MNKDKITQGFGGMTDQIKGAGGIFDTMNKAAKFKVIKPVGAEMGNDFDDTTDSTFSGTDQVKGIVLRTGLIVDGIGILWGKEKRGPFHGSTKGGGERMILFDEGDGLAVIEGCSGIAFGGPGGAVSNLTFKTKKGKIYGPYGDGKSSNKFKLEIPQNGTLKGFCGNAGTQGNGGYLAALGLIFEEK